MPGTVPSAAGRRSTSVATGRVPGWVPELYPAFLRATMGAGPGPYGILRPDRPRSGRGVPVVPVATVEGVVLAGV